jgi:hypothetical protein
MNREMKILRQLGKAGWAAVGVVATTAAGLNSCGAVAEPSELELGQAEQALTATVSFRNGAQPSTSYNGSTDATIRQAQATTNAGNASTCEADGDDGSGVDKSCLLRWTLSTIPAGATINSASITLQIVNSSGNTYSVYSLLRSFDEAQVTWNRASTAAAWGTAGALASSDRGGVIGSVTGSTGSVTINLNAAGVALVQGWVNGGTNAGVIIASTSNTDGIDFASSEASTITNRPMLTDGGGSGGAGGTGGAGSGGAGTAGSAGSAGAGGAGGAGTGGSAGAGGSGGGTPTDPNLLLAFIGDQGNNGDSTAVLQLIANEGAAAVVHNGDFDYADNPTAWDNRITSVLGANYPYFAVIGNHDAAAWGGTNGYSAKIAARHARVPAMQCTGELGVRASCRFRGLQIVESCIGTNELRSNCGADSADQVGFIRSALAADNALFKICSWHKNQHDMQVGTKGNEVGWSAYQECMRAGAIVSTGHEHSYARTRILNNLGNASAGHGVTGPFDVMQLSAGNTFVFVSGLAGVGIRDYSANNHDDDTWWASYYAANRWVKNGTLMTGTGTYGALFVRFNVGGNPKRANAYFKDVNGRLVDEFTIQVP